MPYMLKQGRAARPPLHLREQADEPQGLQVRAPQNPEIIRKESPGAFLGSEIGQIGPVLDSCCILWLFSDFWIPGRETLCWPFQDFGPERALWLVGAISTLRLHPQARTPPKAFRKYYESQHDCVYDWNYVRLCEFVCVTAKLMRKSSHVWCSFPEHIAASGAARAPKLHKIIRARRSCVTIVLCNELNEIFSNRKYVCVIALVPIAIPQALLNGGP